MSTSKQIHTFITIFSFFAILLFAYNYYSIRELRNKLNEREKGKQHDAVQQMKELKYLDGKVLKIRQGYKEENDIRDSIKQLLLEYNQWVRKRK